MEVAKMNRDIEVCIKEKELESFRAIIMSKMGHVEAEAKEDAERAAKALKENLSEKIMEVQASLERIAESAEKQVRLIDEKIVANDANDAAREASTQKVLASSRKSIAHLTHQMTVIAEHTGADIEAMRPPSSGSADRFSGVSPTQSEPVSPKPKFSASGNMRGGNGSGGELEGRMVAAERRLACLDGGDGPDGKSGAEDTSGRRGSPSPQGGSGQPLPARVTRVEDKHEELLDTLEEALGIQLGDDKDEAGGPLPRPLSSRSGKQLGVDRLATLEARVAQLADSIGVELVEVSMPFAVSVPGGPTDGGARAPGAANAGSTSARIGLLDAKMDEVASALGLTPEELEEFARSERKGNLAGRLVLRDDANAMSPRVAGLIAGTEDRLAQMNEHMRSSFRDVDDMAKNKLDKHGVRLRNLEDINGVIRTNTPMGSNLDSLERSMLYVAKEDVNDATGGTTGKTKTKARSDCKGKLASNVVAPSGAIEGGTGAAGGGRENDQPTLSVVMGQCSFEAAAETAAKISEAAAQAAAMALEECQRLKEELAEIVNAVNVPSLSMEDDLFGDARPADGDYIDLGDEERDDAALQYVERQTVMEVRLAQLEDQLDSASVVMPDSQIFSGLKGVVKDVRRCLSRCELLYQLPEVKVFVKRFQRSLQVNAILHDKWLGPSEPGRRQPLGDASPDRPGSAAGSNAGEDQRLNRDNELSHSAPDLRAKGLGKGGSALVGGKREGAGAKKKPFRTVVDWVRPHTPLKIDPVYRGGNGGAIAGRADPDRPLPHLPPISP
jgi:hypothetical protein